MVKKFLSVFAIASMMLATSCSNDEFDSVQNGKESTVTFTAQLPDGLQTKSRAYADGTTATQLQYMVYLVENDEWKTTDVCTTTPVEIHGTKDVSLRLVNGNKYAVVFWADAPSSIYNFDKQNAKVTADYTTTTVANNNKNLDAFYAVEEITVDGSSLDKTVYLKRPFAQLNIGTADWEAAKTAGREVKKAAIEIETYKTLNFKSNKVEGEKESVKFELADLPTGEKFPVEPTTYKYLTMNYLLMPEDKESDNIVTIYYDESSNVPERKIQAVPLQRNYRTNIYGNLLTSTGDITVTIDPEFEEDPGHKVSVWDGKTTKPVPAEVNGVITITSAEEFAGLMASTQNGNSPYFGKAFVLNCDLDFAGHTITGVGSVRCNITFTFDGNNHTVSNFIINSTSTYYAGLFNQFNGTVKNLTVKDATVTGKAMVGAIAANGDAGAVIENCKVYNSTLIGEKKVGAVVGYIAGATVKNCYAENCTIFCADSHDDQADEVIGYVNNTVNNTVDGISSSNVTVNKNTAAVSTAEQLKAALTANVGIVEIAADIDMTGWTAQNVANLVLNGNNHTLKNQTVAFLNDVGGGNVVIKDVNFDNANIDVNTGTNGTVGIVVSSKGNADGSLAIENCKVSNSSVVNSGDSWAGVFLGWAAADGAGRDITIKDCIVENCTAKAGSSVGAFIGHTACRASLTNCKVLGNTTIECLENRNGSAPKAGKLIGTVQGATIITGCEVASTVTLKNTNASSTVANGLIGRNVGGTVTLNGAAVVTAAELKTILTANNNVTLNADYVVTGNWTPILASNNVTINGNNHSIAGLTAPLVHCVNNELNIKNLTIKDATVAANNANDHENGMGNAAFVDYVQNGGSVTLTGCHLANSTVKAASRAAGFVGYKAGANGIVSMDNCSVKNCEIEGVEGAGSFLGYVQEATVTVNNSSANTVNVKATEDRSNNGSPKDALAGGAIGTVGSNANVTLTSVNLTSVTVTNNGSKAVYNEYAGRVYGALTIN